jgi:8-oxo-dGTP pyrophosphatase MutT (NUDIX family)
VPVFPRGDGDGWTYCAQGHKHWGIYGAAGLLLRHDDGAGREWVLLQHRALWSHHGGTWGVLGGARNSDETAERTAAREAAEEAGIEVGSYTIAGCYVDDHGGWSYTTVIGNAASAFPAPRLTAESLAVGWVSVERIHDLPLHPGFAATWERVRKIG